MVHITACFAWLLLLTASALAEVSNPADSQSLYYAHLAVTALGLVFAIGMAQQAFARPQELADTPTFPRYMTSRGQYLLGSCAFILFACFVFLLIVYLHKEVIEVLKLFPGALSEQVVQAMSKNEAPYLLIVCAMGMLYLFVLQKEANWNLLLLVRNVIHSWISVPQGGRKIINEISFALTVPESILNDVVNNSVAVSRTDFRKDGKSIDRVWAELSYMKWWILQRRRRGDDGTFFAEASFGLDQLLVQYDDVSELVSLLKEGKRLPPRTTPESISAQLKPIHLKFARLVACYLLYNNGSKQRLANEARSFGLPFIDERIDNPMRYSIIYILTVILSVYLGVYGSAILFDVYWGGGLVFALTHQDVGRIFSWIMYSLSNYGLAIIAVLAARLVIWKFVGARHSSYLLTYCWTFLLACLVGPLGLTLAAKFNDVESLRNLSYIATYYELLRWGVGPGLVAVCISYFMDRQISSELPDIDTSAIVKRIGNATIFAVFTITIQLPLLLTLETTEPAWSTTKLRAVAFGTTFVITLSLALVAQFGLRRPMAPPALPMPQPAR